MMAINQLKNGSILCGGVGAGKSRTGIGYYYIKECCGSIPINGEGEFAPMKFPKDLYIITTARKRDTKEWELECAPFLLSTNKEISINGVQLVVDSWNNIGKYVSVKDAFFIFDEQRVVGKGAWVKSFIEITKHNNWILLTATPGDTWSDYIPVFIANGFYKNRSEFIRRHAVYNPHVRFPKIDRYLETGHLIKLRKEIMVNMKYYRPTKTHNETILCDYNKTLYSIAHKERWNVYKDKPIKDVSEYCAVVRKITNTDRSRIDRVKEIVANNPKIIIFYNFNYELDLLREMGDELGIAYAEWNGHKHEPIPKTDSWIYLVQYFAGAEGWNCIETNAMIFYSQSYSYKAMIQAAGRIDRVNTPFTDLYYYHIRSNSPIDLGITKTLNRKQDFNERNFISWEKKDDMHDLR